MRQEINFNTTGQLDRLRKIQDILEELHDYKPLTLRQLYYQLIAKEYIDNNKSQYTMLSLFIKWARLKGHISWGDIEDRVRVFNRNYGFPNKESFVNYELRNIFKGYDRDVMQSQDKYIEVWIEKDALSRVFQDVLWIYNIPLVVCRGFSSVSFLKDFVDRLEKNRKKEPVLLYFGDFDPSGVEMLDAMKKTLIDEFGVNGIDFKRVALKKSHIREYKLPHNPNAIKRTDTRCKKHVEKYGDLAVELDALRPDILKGLIKDAVHEEIDIDAYNREKDMWLQESNEIDQLREKLVDFAKENL